MTRSDVWRSPPRPCVARYRAFCDHARALGITLPESGARITFFIEMPKSWSVKKKQKYRHQPHQQVPDLSNLLKALEDAVHPHDETIWNYGEIRKLWANYGAISIY